MAAVIRSIRIPEMLMECLEIRATQLGYASFNAYILGLVIYDLICQGLHTLTLPISKATGRQRDRVYVWLLKVVKRGVGARGVLLNHIVERSQKRNLSPLEAALQIAEEDAEDWSHFMI